MRPDEAMSLIERLENAMGEKLSAERAAIYVEKLLPLEYKIAAKAVELLIDYDRGYKIPPVGRLLEVIRQEMRAEENAQPRGTFDNLTPYQREQVMKAMKEQRRIMEMDDDSYMRWLLSSRNGDRADAKTA